MKTIITVAMLAGLVFCIAACKDSSTSAGSGIDHLVSNYPLAPAGLSAVYIDGHQYPFGDNFDYVEYYSGDDMNDECSYFRNLGYQSALDIDLNADSEYLQLFMLNIDMKPGIYQITDTALAGVVDLSYRFNDSATNILKQKVVSGTLEITKADIANKRVSGIFKCTVVSKLSGASHTMEGSFTDLYLRYEESGGEVMTADISGNGLNSSFSSTNFYDAYGDAFGLGSAPNYFLVHMATDESNSGGYESFMFLLREPVGTGSYNLDSGCAIYCKYLFDQASGNYILTQSDTNWVSIPNAVEVTEFDTIRRRISGTYNFDMIRRSSGSPIHIRNGKFIDLFW